VVVVRRCVVVASISSFRVGFYLNAEKRKKYQKREEAETKRRREALYKDPRNVSSIMHKRREFLNIRPRNAKD